MSSRVFLATLLLLGIATESTAYWSILPQEGWADYWGSWNIDLTAKENLEGSYWVKAWRLIPLLEFGRKPNKRVYWNHPTGIFNRQLRQNDKKAPYYDEGWLMMRFLFSKAGTKYRRPILHAYAVKEPTAVAFVLDHPEIYEEWFIELRRNGGIIDMKNEDAPKTPFRQRYVGAFQRDWYRYLTKEYRRLFGSANADDLSAYYKEYLKWYRGPVGPPKPQAPWQQPRRSRGRRK